MEEALNSLDDQTLIQFVDDTIEFLKGVRVPFLSRYCEQFGGTSRCVAPVRDFIVDAIQAALRQAGSQNLDAFKKAVGASLNEKQLELLSQKHLDIISTCAYARRSELRKVFTELIFKSTSDSVLLDYNYNIEQVIWSDSCKKVAEALLVLELFLQTCSETGQKNIQRVIIEFNIEEAREFVGRLQSIEKEVIAASQGQ